MHDIDRTQRELETEAYEHEHEHVHVHEAEAENFLGSLFGEAETLAVAVSAPAPFARARMTSHAKCRSDKLAREPPRFCREDGRTAGHETGEQAGVELRRTELGQESYRFGDGAAVRGG